MNIFLWILQSFIALAFLYSGISKTIFSEQKLVAIGQTGVAGLPIGVIRFIGIAELLGIVGIILPLLVNIYPLLTSVSAFCLAFIMPFAMMAHYKRKEYKQIAFNLILFTICIFIGIERLP
ncbi:MAG: DoxX family protein [Bacteroidetes bacterium]|nr:DoxX family protein [Bacteroidota bacterium]